MTILHPTPLQAQTPAQDTLAMVQAPDFLSTAEAVSTIVLAVAVLVVLVALIIVLVQLKRLAGSVGAVAKRLEKEAAPVLDRARSVAENVEFITAAVRTDVQKLNESVARLNDRLKQASDRMEERIQDFTALVEVLQDEAEDLALDTAAAVRGVRVGTQSLASGNKSLPPEPEESDALPTPMEGDGDDG
ncbi:hypothetical protein ACFL3Z_00980 [Gemmatimonadota bacterium]